MRSLRLFFLHFIILFFSFLPVFAQFTVFDEAPLEAENIGIEEGLSQSVVNSILQDDKGFMWFGTQDGLNKYNAYKFEVYHQKRGDSTSLISNTVNTLYQSKNGTLWIGTDEGLSKYNLDKNSFSNFLHDPNNKKTLASRFVSAITEDEEGNIWVGTYGGLSKLDPKTRAFKNYFYNSSDESLPSDSITALHLDKDNVLWIGTKKGVAKYNSDKDNFVTYVSDESFSTLPNPVITCFYEDKFRALWVGTADGIGRYNRLRDTFSAYKASPYAIEGIREDEKGNLWVLSRLELGKFDQFNHTYRRQNIGSSFDDYGSFRCMTKGKSGLLWIGTLRDGVYKVNADASQFKTFKHNPENPYSLPPSWVWSIEKANANALWLGTGSGWSYLDIEKDSAVNYDNFFPSFEQSGSRDVSSLLLENDSTLWIGVLRNGVIRSKVNDSTSAIEDFSFYTPKDDDSLGRVLGGSTITKIIKDDYGNIWIGTYDGGLNFAYPDSSGIYHFETYQYNPSDETSITGNAVREIFEDRNSNLWVGTESGLNLAKRDQSGKISYFERFVYDEDDSTTISSNAIRTIWEDESGYLWLGTPDGLNRFDPESKTAKHFGELDVRLNRVIHGILGDKKENLWLSTNQGILKFDIGDSLVWEFNVEDGLQSDEFNSGAYYLRNDGMMFFGGIGGLTMFHPDTVRPNTYLPPVVLTDLKIFNKSVEADSESDRLKRHISVAEEIHLYSADQVVTFEFVALNYLHPENNFYSYRLEGFEKYWNEVEGRRFASYTSLPKGEYVFIVRAANNDGYWNNEGASIRVIVHPPFHQTWWFRLLITLLIGGGVYLVYYVRTKAITEQNIRLENSVKERTGELLETTEELRVQRDQLESAYANIRLLSDMGQKITSTLNHKEIVASVYENLQDIMPTDGFGVALYDEDAECLTISGFIENGEVLPFHVLELSDDKKLGVKCFLEEREIVINDIEQEYLKFYDKKPVAEFGRTPTSVVYLPLKLGNRKMGALTVQSFKENAYDGTHLSILRNLATYIVIALDNARVYSKISAQNVEIEENRKELEERNRDITDSINYAKRIQDALLPPQSTLQEELESFIFYKPRDIVSGDFYWFTKKDDKLVVAAIDCTGHGVPGAFMSIIAETHLNRIVNIMGVLSPARILEELDIAVKSSLRQHETQSRDGMDLALCVIDKNERKVHFAGAKNPLVWVENGKVFQKKGSIRGIGGYSRRYLKVAPNFTQHTIDVDQTSSFYLFSDGYQDQFGGKHNEKFMKKRFRQVLRDIHDEPMEAQKELLERGFKHWKGSRQQIDDVLVIGFRF